MSFSLGSVWSVLWIIPRILKHYVYFVRGDTQSRTNDKTKTNLKWQS